jgi:hypothetical protein
MILPGVSRRWGLEEFNQGTRSIRRALCFDRQSSWRHRSRLYSSWASNSESTRRSCHDLESKNHFFENFFQIQRTFPAIAHFRAARPQRDREIEGQKSRKGAKTQSKNHESREWHE